MRCCWGCHVHPLTQQKVLLQPLLLVLLLLLLQLLQIPVGFVEVVLLQKARRRLLLQPVQTHFLQLQAWVGQQYSKGCTCTTVA
jgi:hypothetical protein